MTTTIYCGMKLKATDLFDSTEERTCSEGHESSSTAKFCSECGDELDSPTLQLKQEYAHLARRKNETYSGLNEAIDRLKLPRGLTVRGLERVVDEDHWDRDDEIASFVIGKEVETLEDCDEFWHCNPLQLQEQVTKIDELLSGEQLPHDDVELFVITDE